MENSLDRTLDESSSSSDEDDRLKEALDPTMFQKKPSLQQAVNKSLNSTNYKDNILDVTPEFQSYVGKHLTDMLDKNIKEHEGKTHTISQSRPGGIKIFNASSEILTEDNFCEYPKVEVHPYIKKKKIRPARSTDDEELTEMQKIRSVAVTPEWILEKHSVKGWCKPKGKEIKVKKNVDGELEVISSFVSQ